MEDDIYAKKKTWTLNATERIVVAVPGKGREFAVIYIYIYIYYTMRSKNLQKRRHLGKDSVFPEKSNFSI